MAGVRAEKSCGFRGIQQFALQREQWESLREGYGQASANMSIARLTRSLTALFLFHAV
jgi:hypothetical protein